MPPPGLAPEDPPLERGGRIPDAVVGASGPVEQPGVKESLVPKGTRPSPGRGHNSLGTSQGHLALPGSLRRGRTHLRLRWAEDAPERQGRGDQGRGERGRQQGMRGGTPATDQSVRNDAGRASVCKVGGRQGPSVSSE